jgi:hypothetical protein
MISDHIEDYKVARAALVQQLERMADGVFPDATLTPEGRAKAAAHIRAAIEEYDQALEIIANA